MSKTINIIMGFDFGMKRIGIAIGQTITKTTNPITTISAKNGTPQWDHIKKLIDKWSPDALIVGIPFNMDGTEQPLSQHARQFAQTLREHYHLPVYEMDERLTTKSAREHLFNEGGYQALLDGQVDRLAAQLILQNWFAEY